MTALPRPINKQGAVKSRWTNYHEASRRAVFYRARGICEAPDCHAEAREWAHAFGRRHIIGEPWCSSPALTLALCPDDHRAIDRGLNPDLLAQLRWKCLVQLCADEKLSLSLLENRSPEGAARECEAALRARLLDCDPED